MADQNITALPKKTSSQLAATDYLLGIDSAEGYQMLIQDLGDYIIQHATSSLAGSNQTLASAITALNSNLTSIVLPQASVSSNADIYAIYDALGNATSFRRRLIATTAFDVLASGRAYILEGYKNSDNYGYLYLYSYGTPQGSVYSNLKSNGSWSGWQLIPTRAELDSLNNRLTYQTFGPFACTTTTSYASTGQSFTMAKAGIVRIDMPYGSGRPTAIGIKMSESASSSSVLLNAIDPDKISDTSGISVSGVVAAGTYYIWARTATNGSSNIQVAYYALSA